MTYSRIAKSVAGLLLGIVAALLMPSGAAFAQSPCYYEAIDTDTSSPTYGELITYNTYSECHEAAGASSAVGSLLSGIGEGLVQQQLNFGAGLGSFATPTGRLRHTRHDGLTDKATGTQLEGFETDEGSVFASGSYDLPGTYFGGKVRINGLLGYDRLHQEADVSASKTTIDAFIYGGSYLWSKGSFYSMSVLIGVSGQADAHAAGAVAAGGDYSYDISGYFSNSVIGYTFDIPGAWKFDLRGGLGHYDISTDTFAFANAAGFVKGGAEAWNASLTGTFFTIVQLEGGVARPYLLLSYKNVFDEEIKIKGDALASFEQADDFGKIEIGLDYVAGPITYGAAGYTEFSEDENTIGLRLGASYKFQ
jgi:hypothetical protein